MWWASTSPCWIPTVQQPRCCLIGSNSAPPPHSSLSCVAPVRLEPRSQLAFLLVSASMKQTPTVRHDCKLLRTQCLLCMCENKLWYNDILIAFQGHCCCSNREICGRPDFDSSADSGLHAVLKYTTSLDECSINTSNAVQHYKGLHTKPETICSLVRILEGWK